MALKVFSSNAGHEGGRVVDIDARLADSRIGREKFFFGYSYIPANRVR